MENIHIADSKHGKGIFASRDIKKGEFVLEFNGPIIDLKDSNKPENWHHSIQIDINKFIGPSGNANDFINHSCNPNTGLKTATKLVSIRDIKKNEEVTFDYSTCMLNDPWEMECNCNEPNCRRIIESFDQLPEKLQEKYIKMGIVPDWILRNMKSIVQR